MQRGWLRILLLCSPLLCLPLMTGCLYHTRKLEIPKAPTVELSADATQLVSQTNRAYNAIESLKATVELQASVGGARKGAVTDYTSFRGFIRLRKPEMLRVLGLLPVVRSQAFDLVSDGTTFKLFIPPKNEAIEGKNSVTTKSSNPLMDLRPSLFFNSILIPPIGPDDQVILTTDNNLHEDPKTKKWFEEHDYLLSIVRAKGPAKAPSPIHELIPERVIRFNRENLQPIEQDSYDKDGNIETITEYGSVPFGSENIPRTIIIKRPLEEFQIVMTIQDLVLNQPLADDQFELEIPEGVPIKKLD